MDHLIALIDTDIAIYYCITFVPLVRESKIIVTRRVHQYYATSINNAYSHISKNDTLSILVKAIIMLL